MTYIEQSSLYVSDQYFANLRERTPAPFSKSMDEHFADALEKTH